jgi:Domain of unknown function (DUF4169)
MGDVVSLRRFRKAKERAEAEARAEANRAKHGRTKSEREMEKESRSLIDRRLDAHRRNTGKDAGDDTGGDEPAA